MRILFTRFPLESAYGGAEVQTLSLMDGLRRNGHEVAFLGSCPVLLEKTKELGIRNWGLGIGKPPVTKWSAISFLWRKGTMKKLLTTHYPLPTEAVFMLSLSEKLLLTDHVLAQGGKVFWVEHDRVGPWLSRSPWLKQLRELSKKVTTICVSEMSRKMYIDLGWQPETVVAIPNGINMERFGDELLRPLSSVPRPLHVGCVARLSHDKGIDVLIHAVADAADVQLTIVGSGREEGFLHKLIADHELRSPGSRGQIQLAGRVDDLGAFYRSIDVLVLPEREHDPFGMVAAEAMCLGVPVIVTDVCGIADYLHNEQDALIVPADDPRHLTHAILSLRDSSVRQRIGEEGKKTARAKFGFEMMIAAYENLLQK